MNEKVVASTVHLKYFEFSKFLNEWGRCFSVAVDDGLWKAIQTIESILVFQNVGGGLMAHANTPQNGLDVGMVRAPDVRLAPSKVAG